MATFVFIHGAGSDAGDWRPVTPEFMRRVARERLGITPDEMPGDHMPMLGHPAELADRLAAYWSEVSR